MLVTPYNNIRKALEPQIQGTCGVYSFYNAVSILRSGKPANPRVPPPKISQYNATTDLVGDSLRAYTKDKLSSGQGEILSANEMEALILAHGYKSVTYPISGGRALKASWIDAQLKAGCPVLIAYLATDDKFAAGARYTTTGGSGDGAHWSLIIDLPSAARATVVEPQAPTASKDWPVADLLESNEHADDLPFARFWSKLVVGTAEFVRQTAAPGMKSTVKKDTRRSISPIGASAAGFKPGPNAKSPGYHDAKLYDLGGKLGDRQNKQQLRDVLIAVVPPHPLK